MDRIFQLFSSAIILSCLAISSVFAAPATYQVERRFPDYFLEHKKYFQPRVYQVGDYPVWSLNNIGDNMANSILIEGDDGVIVYDTGFSMDHGRQLLEEIRKITDKPIRAIIYSLHHPDHINGTAAMVSPEDIASGKIKVIAWHNFLTEFKSENQATGPIQALRSAYYAGVVLPAEDNYHHGCCGKIKIGKSGYIAPNTFLAADQEMTIAGVKLQFFYTGGEALTEFGLYLPAYKTAIVADEIFPSLPNMYTIRGGKYREPAGYLRAMQQVLDLDVEHLLGTHLIPIDGKEKIYKTVTTYRDAIQYINDQTIRYINKGYTTDELKEKFRDLPAYLDMEPFTREMYGTLEHIAANTYAGLIGYFNGDPIEYRPTPRVESARRHVELMGGRNKLFAEVQAAYRDGDYQWAAELATYLIRIDTTDMEARNIKAAAFRQLGYDELNTTWRSWFLTSALELEGKIDPAQLQRQLLQIFMGNVARLETLALFEPLRYQVNAEKAQDAHIVLGYRFNDTNESIGLELRNSVLIVTRKLPAKTDILLSLDRATLNDILTGKQSYADAIKAGKIILEGASEKLNEFFSYMDNSQNGLQLVVR